MPATVRQSIKGLVLGWKEVVISYLHLHFNYRSGVAPAQQWCLWTLWFRVTGGISRPVTICHQSCLKGYAWAVNTQCHCASHSPWIKADGWRIFIFLQRGRQIFFWASNVPDLAVFYVLGFSCMFSFEMPSCVQGRDCYAALECTGFT